MNERGLVDCPDGSCCEAATTSFRMLHNPVDPNRDYLPALVRDPRRELPLANMCIAFGISMFETLEGLERFWNSLNLRVNIKRAIGNQVGRTELGYLDGLRSPSREGDTHFTFFEVRLFVHQGRYEIIKELEL